MKKIKKFLLFFKRQYKLVNQIDDALALIDDLHLQVKQLNQELEDCTIYDDPERTKELLHQERDLTAHLHGIIHDLRKVIKDKDLEIKNIKIKNIKNS